jgi:hypothetical protein
MLDDTPKAENRTLPRRGPNAAYRQREYLTEAEMEKLIDAARCRGRNSARDAGDPPCLSPRAARRRDLSASGRRSIFGMGGCM